MADLSQAFAGAAADSPLRATDNNYSVELSAQYSARVQYDGQETIIDTTGPEGGRHAQIPGKIFETKSDAQAFTQDQAETGQAMDRLRKLNFKLPNIGR